MKIKAAEIARQLGISKATVSLALNNKPGVSDETKKQILQYIEQVENGVVVSADKNIIKILCYFKEIRVNYRSEVDLWTGVLAEFTQEARKDGFTIGIDYLGDNIENMEQIIAECNQDHVAGVILFATEMNQDEFVPFKKINKPMVVYDNDFSDPSYSYVMIDNHHGVEEVIEYLITKKAQKILYLANGGDNYNFRERRKAYEYWMKENNLNSEIIMCGEDVDSNYLKIKSLISHQLPQFLISENYQVSIGAIKAIQELGFKLKHDIHIIGIDEIPDYFCYGHQLTALKVSHNQRAFMAMTLLKQEILNHNCDKFRIYSSCELIDGDTA